MGYLALACDYDGTLAQDGLVDASTLAALESVRATGRKLILVTGRQLDDLACVFEPLHLFDWIVAENGALLYHPASKREAVLAERPPREFIDRLREYGVRSLSVGRVIVATSSPHETTVRETIEEMRLELKVIFNKGAVMVLPTGIDKAGGLAAALERMALTPHNVVGVGDAENDESFLALCECSAAVANALPQIKQKVDFVLGDAHGQGVVKLIDELIKNDLNDRPSRLQRPRSPEPRG
jgi:HAD superfamily hydrolase (TIGR01484 family)